MSQSVSDRLNIAIASYPGLPPGVALGDTWLAKQIGAPRTTVQWWRNGREPTVEMMERLASVLMVEPCWLAFGRGPMRAVSGSTAMEAAELVARSRSHPEKRRRQAE